MNVDNKVMTSRLQKCLLTSINLTSSILCMYIHFSEMGSRRFPQTLEGVRGTKG